MKLVLCIDLYFMLKYASMVLCLIYILYILCIDFRGALCPTKSVVSWYCFQLYEISQYEITRIINANIYICACSWFRKSIFS